MTPAIVKPQSIRVGDEILVTDIHNDGEELTARGVVIAADRQYVVTRNFSFRIDEEPYGIKRTFEIVGSRPIIEHGQKYFDGQDTILIVKSQDGVNLFGVNLDGNFVYTPQGTNMFIRKGQWKLVKNPDNGKRKEEF